MPKQPVFSVLFICLGNICRSPTAEGVVLRLLQDAGMDEVMVDSAGTASWHRGKRPHPDTLAAAARRGYELPSRARQLVAEDGERFDLLLVMDADNHEETLRRVGAQYADKVRFFMDFAGGRHLHQSVPDPYGGGADGFERVLDLCEAAGRGLVRHLQRARE